MLSTVTVSMILASITKGMIEVTAQNKILKIIRPIEGLLLNAFFNG